MQLLFLTMVLVSLLLNNKIVLNKEKVSLKKIVWDSNKSVDGFLISSQWWQMRRKNIFSALL